MPEKIDVPPNSELDESFKSSELLKSRFPGKVWLVQPKFDGCKCLLVPTPQGYVATTSGGNIITRLNEFCTQLTKAATSFLGNQPLPVVEAELEPNPWSPEAKAKLAGNLYNNNPLPFGFTIKPFDYIPANEFFNQAEAKTPFSQRATALVQFIQGLAQAGLTLSCPDTVAMTTEEAETAFAKGIEEGLSSHRVIWQGKPVEGIVLRDPNAVFQGGVRSPSAIKRKPNIDVDILVTHTGWQPKKGAVGMQDARPVIAGIDTKRPENFYVAYGGISKEIAAQLTALKGTVVEINILTTDDPKKGMGNPTFVRTRPDKESHIEPSPKVLEEIRAALEKKGVVIATDPPGVEL